MGFQQHLLLSFVVLSACYFYVNDKRFTRRHESVLKAIWNELCEYFNQNSLFLFKLVAPKAMTMGKISQAYFAVRTIGSYCWNFQKKLYISTRRIQHQWATWYSHLVPKTLKSDFNRVDFPRTRYRNGTSKKTSQSPQSYGTNILYHLLKKQFCLQLKL